jgi:hypothetical protein
MGIKLDQKVEVSNSWLPKDKNLIQLIMTKTLASSISEGEFSVKPSK